MEKKMKVNKNAKMTIEELVGEKIKNRIKPTGFLQNPKKPKKTQKNPNSNSKSKSNSNRSSTPLYLPFIYLKPSVLFFFGSFFLLRQKERSRGVFTHRGKGRRNLVQGAGVGCIHGFTGPSDWRAFL